MILDKSGTPYKEKSASTPNLDARFWMLSKNRNVSERDVLDKPMAYHVWIYSCISTIGRAVSQVKHVLENNAGQNITTHPVLDRLDNPSKLTTKSSFVQLVIGYLMLNSKNGLGGQCFIVPWNTRSDKKVRLDKGEIPDELIPFTEDFFEPMYSTAGRGMKQCTGWKFKIPGTAASSVEFEHGEIIRIAMINPYDILAGISPFNPAYTAVEMDAKSDALNMNNFEEDGRLDGFFGTDQIVDRTILDDAKNEYYQIYTGSQRKKIGFFSGGMKYQQFAKSAADLEYLKQQEWSRSKILGAYGLNRIAVGDYEGINFATIREGRKLLWYDTYIPIDKLILSSFNSQWIKNIKGELKLVSDYSNIPALQSDMKERAITGGTLVEKMGFPPALASRIAGVPLSKEDVEKYPFLEEQKLQAQPQLPIDIPEKVATVQIRKSASAESYMKTTVDPPANMFRGHLDKYFYRQRNLIMANIDHKLKSVKAINKDDIRVSVWEYLPDELKENAIIEEVYGKSTTIQAAYEKRRIETEFKRGVSWDAQVPHLKQWTSERFSYLKRINTATFTTVGDVVMSITDEAMQEGVTVAELAKRIKVGVHDVYEVRTGKPVITNGKYDLGGLSSSSTIARTEMATIASMSRNDIFKSEGIKRIQWLSAIDARPTHLELNTQTIQFGSIFSNGLKFPRDPNGSAGEVINCRCAYVAVFDEDDE